MSEEKPYNDNVEVDQIAEDDVTYWAEKNDLLKRIARLEEQNIATQDQLNKSVKKNT